MVSKKIKETRSTLVRKLDDIGGMVAELVMDKRRQSTSVKTEERPKFNSDKEFFVDLFQKHPKAKQTIKEILQEEEEYEKKDKEILIKMVR